ncbi:MAG: fatty acid desaturase [Candidatus Omnitrophica bacterium]|nr:fatty acid desaturase [Candidatus Omnitrophota bacterium]
MKKEVPMPEYGLPKRKTKWAGVILFAVLIVCGVFETPVYIYQNGLSKAELLLFLFYFFATGMSITVGYHRLFAHATYKTNDFVRFLLLFFGAATYEESALKWASQHRQHHQFTDTELDPHNSKRGFWYCHIGWILFYKHCVNQNNVKDLLQNKLVMHQHKYYDFWALTAGILLPLAIGYGIGRPLGAFLMAVCLRMFLVMNAAFLINSYAHMIGDNSYNEKESARDHWLGALMTNGEGYHSFHHRFPNDYRNGIKWYHWDPTKWFIYTLSRFGMAWDLKRTPAGYF